MNSSRTNVVDVDFGRTREEALEEATTDVMPAPPSIEGRQIVVNGNLYILQDGASPAHVEGIETVVDPNDQNAVFRATVDVDREMERSVLYRVIIMIELIGVALILRSVAIYFT